MARTIIVSDLHVDTWTDEPYGLGSNKKPKLLHWCGLLDWCEKKRIDEFVINGDLMDAPPYEGNITFKSPIARQAIEKLIAYSRQRKVTYIYGNHDIGMSGIRCHGDAGLSLLKNINLYYPDYVLPTPGSTILFQHGHLYDPALILYMRDLSERTYIASKFQAFQWVQQRRDPETGKPLVKPPGVSTPADAGLAAQPDNNIYRAIKATEASAPPKKKEVSAAEKFINRLRQKAFRKFSQEIKYHIWREAAKSVCQDYLKQKPEKKPMLYCVMGHTHVPDTIEMKIDSQPCIYINSGTWTGAGDTVEDRQHATYLDFGKEGKLWIQDWIRNPYFD